jgi:hypothetical protein
MAMETPDNLSFPLKHMKNLHVVWGGSTSKTFEPWVMKGILAGCYWIRWAIPVAKEDMEVHGIQ